MMLHTHYPASLLTAIGLLLSIWVYADFDPTNPPDPYATQQVTVGVTPTGAGKVSGAGKYLVGKEVTISTTPNKDYTFLYWTLNGYPFAETAKSFTYIVGDSAAAFMAHYEYNEPEEEPWVPVNPPEPYVTQHISVDLNPLSGGYTRGTGDYISGENVTIKAIPYVNYALKYWTINDYDWHDTSESFTYTVGDSCVHFVGHLVEKHLLTLKTHPRAAGHSSMSVGGSVIEDMLLAPEEVVDLVTTPNEDYVFRYWTVNGYPHSTSTSYQYTMGDTTASIVAVYDYIGTGDTTMFNPNNPPEPQYREDVTVLVLSADETKGTVSGGGTYPFATIDTLIATPTAGNVFRYWHDGNKEATRVIRAERDTVYIAYFGNDTVLWNDTICYGASLHVGDSVLTETGHYEFYTTRPDGLLTWNIVNLTVWHEMSSQFDAIYCKGEPFHYEGVDYTEPGTYVRTLQNRWGCDSVVTFTLTELPSYDTLITAAICQSERYQLYGFDENTTGQYTQHLMTEAGCDSIIRLDLTVYPEYDTTIVARICRGERYTLNGFDTDKAGFYQLALQTIHGCDSIVSLSLTVDTVPSSYAADTICQGEAYTWYGQSLSTTGTYTYQEPTDSIACGYILHELYLYVRSLLDMQFEDVDFHYCGSTSAQSLAYTLRSGSPMTYTFSLTSDASDEPIWHLEESSMEDGILIPALPDDIWPDQYTLTVQVRDSFCNELSHRVNLFISYQGEDVITQRWNDVLAVRQTAYDNYEGFTAYQWYCDGIPVQGATQSIFYKPEGLQGSSYQVALTRATDGVTILSCPFLPTEQPNTSTLVVTPTATEALSPLQVIAPENGRLQVMGNMGHPVNSTNLQEGVNQITAPNLQGIYLMHLTTQSGQKYVQKIIVY